MVEPVQVVIGVVILAVAAVGGYLAYRGLTNLGRGWTIWRNEPIDAASVRHEDGIVEVAGTVKSLEDQPLTAKYSNQPCVAYDYKLEKKKRKRTADGDTEYKWETVESGAVTQPFYVSDESGEVAVDPDGATVSLDSERLSGGMTVNVGPISFGSQTRKYEGRLEPDGHVHVYGQKRESREENGPDGTAHYIGDGDETDAFTVSDTTEFRTFLRYLAKGLGSLVLGLLALALSGLLSLVLLEELGIAEFGLALVSLL